MDHVFKSDRNCRKCNTSLYVLRFMWTDYYPEGRRHYDDHVCLKCGLYADGSGCSLQESSLYEYRKKYSSYLDPPSPNFDLVSFEEELKYLEQMPTSHIKTMAVWAKSHTHTRWCGKICKDMVKVIKDELEKRNDYV